MDERGEAALRFGPYRLFPQRRLLLCGERPLRIGSRALDLLVLLAQRPGELIGKDELLARVWPGSVVEEGSLRMHVAALRRLLDEGDPGTTYIRNVPLRGYCFVVPVRRDDAAAAHAPPAQPAVAHNLPAALTRPIGREEALARLVEQAGVARCVTLIGPAGIGKSLLALAAAHRLLCDFEGGAWHVDFAPLADAALVPGTLATLLGVPILAQDVLPDIVASLRRRRALLVLDNCEHVVDAVAQLAEVLLAGAPEVHLIATSREPLRAAGERVQRVAALPLPAGPPLPDSAAAALRWPAVELLVERAAASADHFELRDADVPAALQVCQRLDGLPLAIELVAPRAAGFGLRGLAEQLDDHLVLLTPGRRTALPRQRTLHAALGWSLSLLNDTERRVLRRLSVFRARFTLADALAVAAGAGEPAQGALDALSNLVAKSLLDMLPGEPAMYRLLRTTRAYASELLAADAAEARAASRRHAQCVLQGLALAEAELEMLTAGAWRAAHGTRIDDLRATLAWSLEADLPLAAELVAAAAPLWFHLGLVKECLDRLEQLLPRLPALPDDSLREMRLELARGHAVLHIEGAGTRSEASLTRALTLAGALGRTADGLRALWGLFTERLMRGDYPAAREVGERFGAIAAGMDNRQVSLTWHRMQALVLHLAAEHGAARAHAEQALQPPAATIHFLQGNAYQVDHESSTMTPLARVLWMQGHGAEAAALARRAVKRAHRLEHGFSLTYALALAALPISLWQGDLAAAHDYAEQLRDCTVRNSLEFWQSWSRMYDEVLAWRRAAAGEPGPWLAEAARLPGRADMLATLGDALLTPAALARTGAGRNAWCAAEVLRVASLRDRQRGAVDDRQLEDALKQALTLARAQGALAWELRCACSLVQCWRMAGRAEPAQALLQALVARLPTGAAGVDVEALRALHADPGA